MQICKNKFATLHDGRLGSRRWITLGEVRYKSIFSRGWGVPNGVAISWRGHSLEFFRWDDLFWAMRRRLRLGGFRLVAVASLAKRDHGGWITLRGLVEIDLIARSQCRKSVSEFY